MIILLFAIGVALFVGARSERARQAHADWQSYKARIESMRGTRMRETVRALSAVGLLVVVLTLVLHV